MEGMDGMILLQKIQKYNSILPVIMLSGSAHTSDAVRATHQGVFKFLTKPVDPDELFHKVQSALSNVGKADPINGKIHSKSCLGKLFKVCSACCQNSQQCFYRWRDRHRHYYSPCYSPSKSSQ